MSLNVSIDENLKKATDHFSGVSQWQGQGNPRQAQGNFRQVQGNQRQTQGNQRLVQGNLRPVQGNQRPTQGSLRSVQGNQRPTPGSIRSFQGNQRPTPGSLLSVQGNQRPTPLSVQGYQRPTPGNLLSAQRPGQGSQRAFEGNPRQLQGGQRQCAGQAKLFYAHERNCDMYYQCENGTMQEGICPDGLVFDDKTSPDTLKCDLPFDIDCSYRSALQPPRSSEHCPRQYGLYAHETDCSRFWKCAEGHSFSFNCPEGLAYNEYSAHCDWPDAVENCDSETLLRFRCPQPTDQDIQEFGDPRFPYPGDCRKHYVCILTPDGSRLPRLLACDPGLVFNPQTSSCDDPENVSGCQGYYNNLDARRLRELFGR